VTIWFEILIEEDFWGERRSIDLDIRRASCSCESFTFRQRCKHIEEARRILKVKILDGEVSI